MDEIETEVGIQCQSCRNDSLKNNFNHYFSCIFPELNTLEEVQTKSNVKSTLDLCGQSWWLHRQQTTPNSSLVVPCCSVVKLVIAFYSIWFCCQSMQVTSRNNCNWHLITDQTKKTISFHALTRLLDKKVWKWKGLPAVQMLLLPFDLHLTPTPSYVNIRDFHYYLWSKINCLPPVSPSKNFK